MNSSTLESIVNKRVDRRLAEKESNNRWTPHSGQITAIKAFVGGNNVLCQAGRQWGKTSVVLHILRQYLAAGGKRAALCMPRFDDVQRFIDALNDSSIGHTYNGQRKRLTFDSASESSIAVFTSQSPDSIRGSVFDIVLMDEFAYWEYPARMLDALIPTLYAKGGRWLVATTPPYDATAVEAHEQLERLRNMKDVVTIHGKTSDNPALSKDDLDMREAEMVKGSRRWHIEWLGEHIVDPPTTLFPQSAIQAANVNNAVQRADMQQVVVSVDPTTSKYGDGDECGIIVAGRQDDAFYVLDDLSDNMTTLAWAGRTVKAFYDYRADIILVEDNAGGELVSTNIRNVDEDVPIEEVKATRSKVDRAMPIAGLYEAGRVKHRLRFEALERQMQYCVPGRDNIAGDDRLDAMVHAVQWLVNNIPQDYDPFDVNPDVQPPAQPSDAWDHAF